MKSNSGNMIPPLARAFIDKKETRVNSSLSNKQANVNPDNLLKELLHKSSTLEPESEHKDLKRSLKE